MDRLSPYMHPPVGGRALVEIPVSPAVTAHSIIAVEGDGPLEDASDGVVKYRSAHVEGVASELVVRSPHSGMQAEAQTVEEVRRIFLEHSATSACPAPTVFGAPGPGARAGPLGS